MISLNRRRWCHMQDSEADYWLPSVIAESMLLSDGRQWSGSLAALRHHRVNDIVCCRLIKWISELSIFTKSHGCWCMMEDNEADNITYYSMLSLSHCCCLMGNNEVDHRLLYAIAASMLLSDRGQSVTLLGDKLTIPICISVRHFLYQLNFMSNSKL